MAAIRNGAVAAVRAVGSRRLLRAAGIGVGCCGCATGVGWYYRQPPTTHQVTKVALLGNPTSGRHDYDVVFLHGLTGDPIRTWLHQGALNQYNRDVEPCARSHPKTPAGDAHTADPVAATAMQLWLDDIQRHLGGRARVFSVSYPSENGTMSIPSMAHEVSNALVHQAHLGQKDLIFVCHSMGGLVCKEMLVGSDSSAQTLRKATSVVVFYSTPHRGTSKYRALYRIRQAVAVGGGVTTVAALGLHAMRRRGLYSGSRWAAPACGAAALALVGATQRIPHTAGVLGDVEYLHNLDANFFRANTYTRDIKSITFWETRMPRVVAQRIATPYVPSPNGGHLSHGLNYSHRSIIKPEAPNDPRLCGGAINSRLRDYYWQRAANVTRAIQDQDAETVDTLMENWDTVLTSLRQRMQDIRDLPTSDDPVDADAR